MQQQNSCDHFLFKKNNILYKNAGTQARRHAGTPHLSPSVRFRIKACQVSQSSFIHHHPIPPTKRPDLAVKLHLRVCNPSARCIAAVAAHSAPFESGICTAITGSNNQKKRKRKKKRLGERRGWVGGRTWWSRVKDVLCRKRWQVVLLLDMQLGAFCDSLTQDYKIPTKK